MDTHIWYFENSEMGVVVKNLRGLLIGSDGHVSFVFQNGVSWRLTDEEDIENFKRNILGL